MERSIEPSWYTTEPCEPDPPDVSCPICGDATEYWSVGVSGYKVEGLPCDMCHAECKRCGYVEVQKNKAGLCDECVSELYVRAILDEREKEKP